MSFWLVAGIICVGVFPFFIAVSNSLREATFRDGRDVHMITTVENGVHVFYITTDALYDDEKVQSIQRKLNRLLETQPVQSLVLDFTQVHSTGSAGLSMLVRLKTKCEESGCELGLCGMNPTVREVLRITKLNDMFRIRDTAEQFTRTPRLPR